MLSADDDTRFLVLEMGARGPGHIATLCEVTPPHLGVVLNVGSAHAGEFGSREVTARSKALLRIGVGVAAALKTSTRSAAM